MLFRSACVPWWLEKKYEKRKIVEQSSLPQKTYLTTAERKKWTNFQNLKLQDASINLSFNSADEAIAASKKALKYADNCSYTNATAALIFHLENYLPNQKVTNSMESLFNKGVECFNNNKEISERIHLRFATFRLVNGRTDAAKKLLVNNLKDTNLQDGSRSLFWLGAVERAEHPENPENTYWNQLIQENPLSFFAIVAANQMGKDPMSVLIPDREIPIQNRIAGGWNENNLQAFLYDLLYVEKSKNTEVLEKYLDFMTKDFTAVNSKLLLYWALNEKEFDKHSGAILALGRYHRHTKNYKVSPKLLDIHYPRIYLNEIIENNTTVDPLLVLALMRQESAFNPEAHSRANARGLMQILPATARTIEKNVQAKDLYDPETNIKIGISYMEKLFEKYSGQTEFVLAAYNAGPNNIDKWIKRVSTENTLLFSDYIPFKETRNYITIILRNYYWYSRLLKQDNNSIAHKVLEKMTLARKADYIDVIVKDSLAQTVTADERELFKKIYIFGDKTVSASVCKFCGTKTGDASNSISPLSAIDISK